MFVAEDIFEGDTKAECLAWLAGVSTVKDVGCYDVFPIHGGRRWRIVILDPRG